MSKKSHQPAGYGPGHAFLTELLSGQPPDEARIGQLLGKDGKDWITEDLHLEFKAADWPLPKADVGSKGPGHARAAQV